MSSAELSGLVVVDKPAGMTSHDVVGRVRRLAGTRKVGHAGTLDPMATGVLLLGVGRGTRLLGHLALTEKTYDATARLGVRTDTDDADGVVLTSADAAEVDDAAVRASLARFVGQIEQVPAAVSAVKIGGRRAYARVRAGEQVELPARPVTVHDLAVTGLRREDRCLDVDFSVRCSSGTYVRALARDLGAELGVGGHLTALRRTAVGPVSLSDATPLAELERLVAADGPARGLRRLSLEDTVRRFFATVTVGEADAAAVRHGRPLDLPLPRELVALLGPDHRFLALYRQDPPGTPTARPVAVFT